MKSPLQIHPPSNWQDFEELCRRLWGEVWQCPNEIMRNGKMGDNQNGVDIYAIPKGETNYFGIQCKLKEQFTDKKLTTNEIDFEIEKAKSFQPALKFFIFATTASKNAKIEEHVRCKRLELRRQGLFSIMLYSWEDICALISSYRTIYDWYVNDVIAHLKADLYFKVNSGDPSIITINPEYIRLKSEYKLKAPQQYNLLAPISLETTLNNHKWDGLLLNNVLFSKTWRIDKRRSKVPLILCNEGDADLQNIKLEIIIENEKIEKLDGPIQYNNDPYLNDTIRAELNRQKSEDQEVFEYRKNEGIKFIPKHTPIVRNDSRCFHFYIIPKQDVENIMLHWRLYATDYNAEGYLCIKVEPKIIDKVQTIEVEKEEELLPTTIKIVPNIEIYSR